MRPLTFFPILASLTCATFLFAQSPGEDTPTGIAGGFGGTIEIGSGSFDPYELNATRSVTDVVVPGAVVPFAYTRIWNSRGAPRRAWSNNWGWAIRMNIVTELPPGSGANDFFLGYFIDYPDGRVVAFNKPANNGAPGDPGTYWSSTAIKDRFVIESGRTAAHLYLADGSVVNFAESCTQYGCSLWLTSVDDPYKRRVTISADSNGTTITEPAGRWIHVSVSQRSGNTATSSVTTSLGQSVDYSTTFNASGTYVGGTTQAPDPYAANVLTTESSVIFNDVIDPASGQPLQAHYTYKNVQPWPPSYLAPTPQAFDRLVWASDPMFKGPLKQVRYIYQDNPTYGGPDRTAISEERYATSLSDAGTMVNRIQMQPWTYDTTNGYSEGYWTRIHTRGDGGVRTISYWNPTTDYGQNLVDHITDFTNNLNQTERHEYDWTRYSQTPIKITDMRGKVTLQQLEPVLGKVTKQTYPDGSYKSWTYTDPSNPYHVASTTDERGKITTYRRDALNRIWRIDYPTDINGVQAYEEFAYDNMNRVTRHRRKNGAYEHFAYNARGLLATKWNPTLNAAPGAGDAFTSYTYYPVGHAWVDRAQKETHPANAQGLIASETYEYERNASNQPCAGRGLVTKVTHADNTFKSFGYDKYGSKLWEENELRQRTSYTYDNYNRLTGVTDPLVHTTIYTYQDIFGAALSPYTHATTSVRSVTDPAGVKTVHTYDVNYRKISTTAASGTALAATTWFAYDAVGNLTTVTDPRGSGLGDPAYTTKNEYDNRNRKWRVTDPQSHATAFGFDPASNITIITRPDGKSETKVYDNLNRLWKHTEPVEGTTTKSAYVDYTPGGMLWHVTDAKNQTTTFEYDEADLKTKMTYPNSTDYQAWTYDDMYNLVSRRAVNNINQTFKYDIRNRQTRMDWSSGVDYADFDYDDAGRLTLARNGSSTVNRQYDAAGHLTHDTQATAGGTEDVVYTYGGAGRLIEVAVGTGASQSYDQTLSYDAMGRVQYLGDNVRGNFIKYTYDKASNITRRDTLPPFISGYVTYPRDNLNRMTSRSAGTGAGLMSTETYGYDVMSRLTTTDRTEDGKRDQFGYDYSSQLVSAKYGLVGGVNPSRTASYDFDLVGNRELVVDAGISKTYTPNILNQYNSAGSDTVTNGSKHEVSAYKSFNYTYIGDGRLQKVTGGGNTYTMAYDALGRCVSRTLNGSITYYYYDGEKPFQETGAVLATNVYGLGIDEIVIRFEPTQIYYFFQDHEGSVTHVRTSAGLVEQYRYDAFGAPTIKDGAGNGRTASAIGNRFMFTGREWNETFDFYEYRARAYHPGLGRFMSEDPKGFEAGDYNLFRYCGNDPVDRTDPMGLMPVQSYSGMVEVKTEEIRQVITGSWIPQVVGTQTTFTGSAAAVRAAATALIAGGGNFTVAQVSAVGSSNSQGAGHKSFYEAAMSRMNQILARLNKVSTEAWAPVGIDDRTNLHAAGSVRDGIGVVRHFRDAHANGSDSPQVSVVSRGDLPKNYRLEGFILGHRLYNPRYINLDLQRAREAHMSAVIVAPPPSGTMMPIIRYEEYHP
jgi:RHS repeat-associated protein